MPAKIKAEAKANEATLWLYDAIDDYWGINAGDFARAVAALAVDTINLRINSPGGDVFGARAIVAALRGSGAKVVAHIDGLAASAATFIAANCDEVRMAEGAFYMIHQASCLAWGDSNVLRTTADLLDKVDGTIVADYARKTGQPEQQIRDWMAAETWFSAAEAKDYGFVDQIVVGPEVDNSAWDFSDCRNAPTALLKQAVVLPAAVETETTPQDDAANLEAARAQAARVLAVIQLGS